MSTEHRFAIGAGILAAPLLAASIGFLADSVWASEDRVAERRDKQIRRLRQGLAVVTRCPRPRAGVLRPEPAARNARPGGPRRGGRRSGCLRAPPGRRRHATRVQGACRHLPGGACRRWSWRDHRGEPRVPSFDEARITIRDQSVVTGGYITSTDNAVVLTTRCEVIEAVPRDRIERISVGPGEVKGPTADDASSSRLDSSEDPFPGGLAIEMVPPSASTRSTSPVSPDPPPTWPRLLEQSSASRPDLRPPPGRAGRGVRYAIGNSADGWSK